MYHNERDRANSLILGLLATQTPFGRSENRDGLGGPHRLSLDSKCAQISHQELLSMVDDSLLVQEVKARLISSEIEQTRKKKRSGSVKDLVKAFDNVQLDGPSNNEDRSTVRFLIGQFTFDELCDELGKRRQVDEPANEDTQDRRFSHWNGLRRTLFSRRSRTLSQSSDGKVLEKSMFVIPEIIPPEREERQEILLESDDTFKESELSTDANCLQVPKLEKKPSFEPDLQNTTSISAFLSPYDNKPNEDEEDEKFMDVLDEVFTLKQTLWNVTRDMEELSEKATKLRCDLAKLRQMRTVNMKN